MKSLTQMLNESKQNPITEAKITNSDVAFFKSIVSKKFECIKDYVSRKNSMSTIYAKVGDVFKIDGIRILSWSEDSGGVYAVDVKQVTDQTRIASITLDIDNLTKRKYTFEYIPDIDTKRKFMIYFREIK